MIDVRKSSATYDRVLGNFEGAISQLMQTGMVELFLPEGYDRNDHIAYCGNVSKQWPIGVVPIRKIIKQIARELKRPIVIIESAPWMDERREITLRRRQFLSPLVAPFMLLPEEGQHSTSKYQRRAGGKIKFRQDTVNWYVKFDDRDAYEEWRNYTLSDPTCRRALKLPPLPAEVIPLAA